MARAWTCAAAVLLVAAVWGWGDGAAAVEIATVAKTGDVAPGTGGATFTVFGIQPSGNAAGEIGFRGSLSDFSEGVWTGGPAGLSLVALSGQPAPGTGGQAFLSFNTVVLNGAGTAAFVATLADLSTGIWVNGPAGLALVARTGDPAPDGGGATFDTLNVNLALNEGGEVAVAATLNDSRRGFWLRRAAGLVPIVLDGQVAPGAGGRTFALGVGSPVLNRAGQIVFFSGLSGGDAGIWRGSPVGLDLVAKTGDLAPGAGGATFMSFPLGPALNGAGEVGINAGLSGGGSGIWRGQPGGLELVVRSGDPAPGLGGPTFTEFFTPVLNGAGELAFRGAFGAGGFGYWRVGPAGFTLLASTGTQAPGVTSGASFSSFGSRPSLNGAGELAFTATLTGPGVTAGVNDDGYWAGAPGDLQLIAREGDPIQLAPGNTQTIPNGTLQPFRGSGNEEGRPSGLSEGGQMGLLISFGPGSQAVFLAPPEAPEVQLLTQRPVESARRTVFLPLRVANPVVIAGLPSSEDRAPGVVRLDKVGPESFDTRFREWRYLDGDHPREHMDFLVLEKGRHTMADGSKWEAGTLSLKGNRRWKRKRFTKRFRRAPQVFVTVQSFRGKTAVAARVRNVTRKSFEVSIQEEEKDLGGRHPKETVGYLAIFSSDGQGAIVGGINGTAYRFKQTKVNHRAKPVLGSLIKLEEERSEDKERRHKKETVSVMTLGRGLFAQQASDREDDTTAIRRR